MKYKTIIIALLLVPGLVFAQNTTVLPNAGITPESPFYFLDRLGETIRSWFTFGTEAKIKLQIELAGERIAEIEVIVREKGVSAKGIQKAQNLLLANVAKAAEIIEKEKASGKDVSELAKRIDDEFDEREELLIDTFLRARAKLHNERLKIKAELTGDIAELGEAVISTLKKELEDIELTYDAIKQKKEEIKLKFRTEKEKIEKELDDEDRDEDQEEQKERDEAEEDEEDEFDNEIEVEIENGVTKVKVEYSGVDEEYILQTTDQEAILAEIASRLGVSVDEIRSVTDFEIEEPEEEEAAEMDEEEEGSEGEEADEDSKNESDDGDKNMEEAEAKDNQESEGNKGGADAPSSQLRVGDNGIYVADQLPTNQELNISLVFFGSGGYVVIHEESEGKPGAIIGSSELLSEGDSNNVKVALKRKTAEGETMFAMLHQDNGDNEFNAANDSPLRDAQENIVMMKFSITDSEDEGTEVSL